MATTAFEGVDCLNLEFGQSVVVYGIGAVGLLGICACILKGAGRVIGIGSRPICFDIAKEYGATDLVNYKDGDVVDQVFAKNGGPVDRVLVCGGSEISVLANAVKMVRPGGTVINVAAFMHDKDFVLPNDSWYFGIGDKTIRGCVTRGGGVFLERLMSLCQYGRFQPEKIVTSVFHGMEHIPEALDKMGGRDRNSIKPVVFFDK
ncbi:MAG: zinc-binding dehydrogenase [Gracilibacteraceae bacterium]|jgi:threonine dehydrogenase-like Zn-dependent dehydrogenase|nr:zinc-binding dehydrogenase [Gracilibacteraceae bacterium]